MSEHEKQEWIERFIDAISDDPDLELDVRIILALRDEPTTEYPQRDSNPHPRLRRPSSFPLDDEGKVVSLDSPPRSCSSSGMTPNLAGLLRRQTAVVFSPVSGYASRPASYRCLTAS